MIADDGKYYLYRHIRLDKNEPFYIDNMEEYQSITQCAITLFGNKSHKHGISKALKYNKKYKGFTFKTI